MGVAFFESQLRSIKFGIGKILHFVIKRVCVYNKVVTVSAVQLLCNIRFVFTDTDFMLIDFNLVIEKLAINSLHIYIIFFTWGHLFQLHLDIFNTVSLSKSGHSLEITILYSSDGKLLTQYFYQEYNFINIQTKSDEYCVCQKFVSIN